MTKKNQDLEMWAGDTKKLQYTVLDENDDPVNLTNATINWWLAESATSTAILTKTTADDISITDAANGVFQVTINPADTQNLEGRYYHEAEVTDDAGNVATVAVGVIKINPSIG